MIYQYDNYIQYLDRAIKELPKGGRGFKSLLAEKLECKTSHISQVFSRKLDFNMDQAIKVAQLLNLNPEEIDYFLTLVEKERAGTHTLKNFFEKKIKKTQIKKSQLKNVFEYGSIEEKEAQLIYFSSVEHILIHILISIPQYRKIQSIARILNMKENRVEKITKDLIRFNLIEKEDDQLKMGRNVLHLPDDASMISNYHSAWRSFTIRNLFTRKESDIHYSSAITLKEEDALKLKHILNDALKKSSTLIKNGPAEKAYSLCIDFFEISEN